MANTHDTVCLTCSKKLTCSQLSPQHGTSRKIKETSSSAVAKRPRDALCLSAVSFNSTKRRAEPLLLVMQATDSALLNGGFGAEMGP